MGCAFEQRTGAVVAQREHVLRAALEGDLADPAKILRAANHHGRFGVANEILYFSALIGRVQRQKHITGAQRGQVQHQRFHRFFHLHSHACTGRQLQRHQQIGHHGGGAFQVLPGIKKAVVSFDGGGVEVGRKSRAQG